VPWLAPVIVPLNDFWEFKDAQLMRQKIAACFAAFIEDTDSDGMLAPSTSAVNGKPIEELGPGIVETLPAGKKITFAEPPSVGDFSSFNDATARDIAVGIGITFEALTANLREVNFTSGRMGRIDMDANVDAWRWLTVIPQFCGGVARWFAEAVAVQTLSSEPFSLGWTPPRRPLVDPTKEIPAMTREVRAGFSSRSRKIRELGFDPEEIMAEVTADNEFADAQNLVFDSDPRRVSVVGSAQKTDSNDGGTNAE
jgi:lambda family phage portal protein